MPESRHVIQLRGPWFWRDAEPADAPAGDVAKDRFRFKFPTQLAEIVRQSRAGRVLLTRDFGLPSGLSREHVVVLAIDPCTACRETTLNGHRIACVVDDDGVGHGKVTEYLRTRNQLQLLCEFSPHPAETVPLREVRLEIVQPS